ncbi:MAG: sulfatase [Planctomycetota bacterium]|jgi:arylsulfatase A-like enzyme|nr:sulfatase [Planctomycetota bacterium]
MNRFGWGSLLITLMAAGCSEVPETRKASQHSANIMGAAVVQEPAAEHPNVVIIFTDDQGYGDLSCYGHPSIRTPNIDRLAEQGARLTDFYMVSSVCTPSRAALLTGCYPKRVGLHERVIFPPDDHGLHPDELTLAELLQAQGYATGIFGKWHLGHRPGLLPLDQGFDHWYGVPYSNDMAQFHREPNSNYRFRLPLMRDAEVISWEPNQRLLTKRYTDAAVDFIAANQDQPFFVYLPHSMPHVPLFASERFRDQSAVGLYGDVIEEIDWSVGQVMAALEEHGLAEDTLVIFTSDNGPWLSQGANGGSAGPLRGGKGSNWEGGQRVPCVVRYPKAIAAGSVFGEMHSALDIFPTVAALVGVDLPEGVQIDGHDVMPLWAGKATDELASRPFLYYSNRNAQLVGIRRGRWKLRIDRGELYDLHEDIGETTNLAATHVKLVEELQQLARGMDAEITANARPVGVVEEQHFEPRRPR